MQYERGRTAESVRNGTDFAPHTGQVLLDKLLGADGIFVNDAMYGPGARTYWHVHEHGQVMIFNSGRGAVATRDGQLQMVGPGDVVYAPPGEEHWHGAAPDCFVTYTSISLGSTETYEEVSSGQYQATWQ